MDEQIRAIAQQVFNENSQGGQYSVYPTSLHTHNGTDSLKINQNDILPGTRINSGSVAFSQQTRYTLGITFNPTRIDFFGNAIGANLVFTVTAANATAGATYTNNSSTFTVLTTIAGATTLVTTSGSGNPASSGTLTKATGTGDATITFSSVTTNTVRVNLSGGALLGGSYYFQPSTSTSVTTADTIQNITQASQYFAVSDSGLVRTLLGQTHIVDVQYPVGTTHARMTVESFTSDGVVLNVETLDSGWTINGNFIIT